MNNSAAVFIDANLNATRARRGSEYILLTANGGRRICLFVLFFNNVTFLPFFEARV